MKLTNADTADIVTVNHHRPHLARPSKAGLGPRVLVFDIETTPMLSWHWRCYKENISPVQIVKYTRLLCWAAKWLDSDTIYFDSTQGDGEDDKRACETLWQLCDRADVLVAHNGQAFDVGTMNARWCYHKIAPPSPAKVIDTLKIARKNLNVASNKLDALVRYFELGGKLTHEGFSLWLKCMDGDKAAWERMEAYNIQDVLVLEDFYLRVRPWASQHPNMSLFYTDDQRRCVCCGGRNLTPMREDATTPVSRFPAWRCSKCGKVMRSGKREKPDKEILRNVV